MACALRHGDMDEVEKEIAIILSLADEIREPLYLNWAHILVGMRAIMNGQWAEAERAAQAMMALWQRFQMTVSFNNAAILLYEIRRSQGRLAELEGPLQIIRQQTPNLTTETGLAFMYCEEGQTDEAQVIFDQLAADGFENIPRDLLWTTAISLLIYVARSLEDKERTKILYDLLLPFVEQNLVVGDGIIYIGSAALVLGVGRRFWATGTPLRCISSVRLRWSDAVELPLTSRAASTSTPACCRYVTVRTTCPGRSTSPRGLSPASSSWA